MLNIEDIMDQKEFVSYISESFECTVEAAETVVQMFTESVSLAMSEGHNVSINNLGKFAISTIPSRKVKVPKSNKLVTVKEHNRPYFIPAKDLKVCCNF
jgi:nucleoid DNA-binding protein